MSLQAGSVLDLVATTLANLDKGKVTDLMTDLQSYYALPNILQKEKISFKGGTSIKVNAVMSDNGSARNTGLYETVNRNKTDSVVAGEIPWRHTHAYMMMDEREMDMNTGDPALEILEMWKIERARMFQSMAGRFESDFWAKPVSSTDTRQPFGLEYWNVYNATTGFTGGNPAGFTSGAAGLDTSTYTRWKNYSANYSVISQDDLIDKVLKAIYCCSFQSPVDLPGSFQETRFGFYTVYSVKRGIEKIMQFSNDSLADFSQYNNTTLIKSLPVHAVPQLDVKDAATAGTYTGSPSAPFYGIDWNSFSPVFLSGWWLKEKPPAFDTNQPTVILVDCFSTYNYRCTNRRNQFVMATGMLS